MALELRVTVKEDGSVELWLETDDAYQSDYIQPWLDKVEKMTYELQQRIFINTSHSDIEYEELRSGEGTIARIAHPDIPNHKIGEPCERCDAQTSEG